VQALLLGLRLVLAASFTTAAIAKLRSARAFRSSLRGFGLQSGAAKALSLLIPLAELGAAVLLLPASSSWLGALCMLALLVVFSGAVILTLAKGRAPDCRCFGGLFAGPIGWHTLLRNAGFIAGASLIVLAGPHHAQASAIRWLADAWRLPGVSLGVHALALCAVVLALSSARRRAARAAARRRRAVESSRAIRSVARRPRVTPRHEPGPPTGNLAPAFSLMAASGGRVSLDDLRSAGLPVLLVFVSPACRRCRALEPRLAAWRDECRGSITMAVVSQGSLAANRRLVERHGSSNVLLQEDREAARAYRAGRTPAAVLITAGGTIASALAFDAESIRALVSPPP
jgi:peroxiredoxin